MHTLKHAALMKRILLTLCILFMCATVFVYVRLNRALSANRTLGKIISHQTEQISSQKDQIQNFATQINAIKSTLVDLNNFEKKIRTIANIENGTDLEGLFGVGGSMSTEIDTTLFAANDSDLIREMHGQVKDLHLASANQKMGFDSLLKHLTHQRNLLSSIPTICPTAGWTTSRFDYRISPFTGQREFHRGMDIAAKIGTPVVAPADGIISFVGAKGMIGNMVIMDHGHGILTRYGHLSTSLRRRGEPVKRGDIIALVGNTGRTTGPHLHYEVLIDGVNVNPEKYILN